MNSKRATLLTVVLCALTAVAVPSIAQDAADPGSSGDEGKVGFFGDRFALYVEAATGATSLDDMNTTIDTGLGFRAINNLSFDDFTTARFAVGWKLPFDRGALEIVFDGYREDGYQLSSEGQITQLANTTADTGKLFTWWFLDIDGGVLNSGQFPPTWNVNTDDTNGNLLPDEDELVYPATPTTSTSRSVTESLDNTWQTVDVRYRREFGGTRYGGRWSGGVRYFGYEGNLVAPAWIGRAQTGVGYTEGAAFSPLTLSQKTEGIGPSGSLGFVMRLFRERLELYADGRAAFVLSTLETDSGEFLTVVADNNAPGIIVTAPARVSKELDKDVWQVAAAAGVRWSITGGLSLSAEYFVSGYQDAIVVATDLTIPETVDQINRGAGALFDTTDLRFDGWKVGLGFQF